VQARRDGLEIEGITLWLFGGIAKFKGQFPSAGAEFRIAIAGPLVSLALGVVFVLAAWATPEPEEVDAVVAWLGYINLTLLAFNLLPALPLDGGRVLRSIIWQVRGDFREATRLAATVGRGFGYFFIALGIFMFVFQGSFSGAWLAFIGWFLLQAATAEDRYAQVSDTLGDLRVRDLMIRDPVTVDADATLGRFMDDVAWSQRYTSYPVVDDGRVVGLLTFRCVAETPRSEWDQRSVRDCMIDRKRVPVLEEDEPAVEALAELSESEVNRGVVLDGERLAGFLSITDLARALEVGEPRRRRRVQAPPTPV
jgi:CBS domain-containing protein